MPWNHQVPSRCGAKPFTIPHNERSNSIVMNTLLKTKTITLAEGVLLAIAFLSISPERLIGGEQPLFVPANQPKWSSVEWGSETNGYCGGITMLSASSNRFQFDVRVRRISATVDSQRKTNFLLGPLYLSATNWFCGPVELHGPNGELLVSGKPSVVSSKAYPDTFSWEGLFSGVKMRSGPAPGDSGLFRWRDDTNCSIGFFNLTDYYSLTRRSRNQKVDESWC